MCGTNWDCDSSYYSAGGNAVIMSISKVFKNDKQKFLNMNMLGFNSSADD